MISKQDRLKAENIEDIIEKDNKINISSIKKEEKRIDIKEIDIKNEHQQLIIVHYNIKVHNKQINRRRVDNCIYNIIIEDVKKKKLHNIGKEQNIENDVIISLIDNICDNKVDNNNCINIMILDNVYQNKSLINIRCNNRLDHLQAAYYSSTLGFNSHLVIIDQHSLASFTFSSFTFIIVMTLKHNIENSIYNYIIRILKHCNLDIYIRHFASNLYRFTIIKVDTREENNINIDIDKEQEKIEHTRGIDHIDLVNTLHLERGQSISTTEMHISILEHFAHDKTAKNCHINIVIILAFIVGITESIHDKRHFVNIITIIALVAIVINIVFSSSNITDSSSSTLHIIIIIIIIFNIVSSSNSSSSGDIHDIFINIIISSSSGRRVTTLPVIITNIIITNVIVNSYFYIIVNNIINSSISSKCTMHIYIIIIIIITLSVNSSSRIDILQLIINIIINNVTHILDIIIRNLLFIIKTIITNIYWNISIIITIIIQYNLIIDIEHNNTYNIKININSNETVTQIYINIINLVFTHTINNKIYLEYDITIILAYTGFIITERFQTFNDALITTYKFIINLYLFKPIVCTINIDNMDTINIKYVITDPLHRKVRHHRYISEIDDIRRRCTLHLGDASTRMHQHYGYIEGIADIEDRCQRIASTALHHRDR